MASRINLFNRHVTTGHQNVFEFVVRKLPSRENVPTKQNKNCNKPNKRDLGFGCGGSTPNLYAKFIDLLMHRVGLMI